MHIDTICMESSLLFLRGCGLFFFLQKDVFLSLKIVFILANKANPDELPTFYLGLELFANSI